MKFKLSLMLLLSLMWQAAASADEWTNIATAVTVTEGRLCAGELAADGTGTDILCDVDHPTIDSSGNVTVSGELSATTLNATQLCDEDGGNCRDLSDASSMVVSTTTMVSGLPDAIKCNSSGYVDTLYPVHSPRKSNSQYVYRTLAYSTGNEVEFNTSGNIVESAGGYTDCTTSHTLADLYANGQAFNYLGNNGAQISLTEIADVSAASPSEGEVLSWNNSSGRWEPSATASAIDALGDIGDVSTTVATEGQVLAWDDTNKSWEPSETSVGVSALVSLTDVSATDAVTGSILRYDGTSWTAVADLMTAMSTTTVIPSFPDAIFCSSDGIEGNLLGLQYNTGATVKYLKGSAALTFTPPTGTGSASGGFLGDSYCNGKTIAELYANGRAFNFLGNNGAQTSMTEIADVSASAPTEGQLLSYDASENEWVATDVISKTIIYNSIDEEPCVVTGGVHKLSFNPTTGRLRVCRP